MFVQVIKARAADPAGLRKEWEYWIREVVPSSIGLLGITGGVADDGTFIVLARFSSEEKARRNSDRPEQGRAWAGISGYLDGEAAFYDCTEVHTILGGGSDEAGFVQIVQLGPKDARRGLELEKEFEKFARRTRPDLIGAIVAVHPDGGSTEAAYFTTEKEARAGEGTEPPAELKASFEEWLSIVPRATFIDLHDPWLVTP